MRCSLRLAAAVGVAALVAGCQVLSSIGGEVREFGFQPSDNPVTVDNVTKNDKLAELAKGQHPRILATYGGEYSDPKLERMVAKVVGNLTLVSGNPAQTYRITILNSPNVNAFALPGGYLYVTRGLLALANDSAELAAVIAHEMGHVTANHGLQRQQLEAEEELATKVVSDVLGESPSAKAALIRGKLQARAVLAQPGTRGRRDRHQDLGQRRLRSVRGGALPAVDGRLQRPAQRHRRGRRQPRLPGQPSQRAAAHRAGAAPCPAVRRAGHRRARPRFLPRRHRRHCCSATRRRKAMCAAPPSCIRGLGISFSVPPGFVIDNSAAAVTATGPGDIAIRFDGVAIDRNIPLADYVKSGWVAGLEETSVRVGDDQRQRGGDRARAGRRLAFDITVIRAGGQVYRLLTAAPVGRARSLDSVAHFVGVSFKTLSAVREGGAEAAAHPRRHGASRARRSARWRPA